MATGLGPDMAYSDFDLFNLPYFNLGERKINLSAPYYRSTFR